MVKKKCKVMVGKTYPKINSAIKLGFLLGFY
jgi:hypothetical protein